MARKDLDTAVEMLWKRIERRADGRRGVLSVSYDCDGLLVKVTPETEPASFPATCGGHRVYILRDRLP